MSKRFPVMVAHDSDLPRSVLWSRLDDIHAKYIHSQSLEKLASRGGLCPVEIVLNVEARELEDYKNISKEYAANVVRGLAN